MNSNSRSNDIVTYNGDIVAGSLLITESRIIAKLLLRETNEAGWHRAIVIDNLLQKRSPVAAQRQARLIKNRLSLMGPDLWEMVHTGTADLSTQALLAAAIKHSRLLGDFYRNGGQRTLEDIQQKDYNQGLEKLSRNMCTD